MELKTTISNNILTIEFFGDIDEHSAKALKIAVDKIIDNSKQRNILFDFKGVNFIDSTGLGFVLTRYKHAREKGISIAISNTSKQVDKVFSASGVYSFCPKI
ncbi:MAG: STAS domain-containing protein [Clostridia bacterium]|nr:STAS domain-containing protein [Clostridia bacterium]